MSLTLGLTTLLKWCRAVTTHVFLLRIHSWEILHPDGLLLMADFSIWKGDLFSKPDINNKFYATTEGMSHII